MRAFRLALVTGASSGVGKEIAALLQAEGIPTIVTARNIEGKDALPKDLSRESDLKDLLDVIRSRAPDLVINNAGFGIYGEAFSNPVDEQVKMCKVNMEALLEITLVASKTLIERKEKGVILNVSSAAGNFPTPLMSVYGATKAFVTNFSKGLDMECRPYGVRVLVAAPGMIATPFSTKAAKKEIKEKSFIMSPSFAAEEILRQIEKRKGYHIFDWRYRVSSFLGRFIPEYLIKKVVMRQLQRRL